VFFETKGKGEGKVSSDDECMHGVIIYASLVEMISPSMFFFFVVHRQTMLGCIVLSSLTSKFGKETEESLRWTNDQIRM